MNEITHGHFHPCPDAFIQRGCLGYDIGEREGLLLSLPVRRVATGREMPPVISGSPIVRQPGPVPVRQAAVRMKIPRNPPDPHSAFQIFFRKTLCRPERLMREPGMQGGIAPIAQ